ncbi:helix-turn-helix domain-containing protein [Bosea vestrisii]|uniref:Helix-turn-helix domain-containing protein n=1 Tax=Bosea vestrisii TaxID=151416 RepID=A0ABW0H7U7_9HYPH
MRAARGRTPGPPISPLDRRAKARGLSAGRLHEAISTFCHWLLATRLEESRRALLDPRRAGEGIASIAYCAGFNDLSVFNRAFRNRFGMTPSDLRGTRRN